MSIVLNRLGTETVLFLKAKSVFCMFCSVCMQKSTNPFHEFVSDHNIRFQYTSISARAIAEESQVV